MTHFIVTNATDAPAKVSIAAETIERQPGNTTCPIGNWSNLETNLDSVGSSVTWRPLAQERYKLNQQSCSAELEIFPGESISISTELNYSENEHTKALPPGRINKLAIRTKDGEILFTGLQIAKHFVRVDKVTYTYTIK